MKKVKIVVGNVAEVGRKLDIVMNEIQGRGFRIVEIQHSSAAGSGVGGYINYFLTVLVIYED